MFDLHETLSTLGYGEPWMSPATWSQLDAKDHGIGLVRKSRAKAPEDRVVRGPSTAQTKSAECKKYYASNAEKLRAKRRERHAALSPEERRAVNRASKLRARIRLAQRKTTLQ